MCDTVRPVTDADKKAQIAAAILRALPEWFGIEESTAAYIQAVKEMDFWAIFSAPGYEIAPVGFLALHQHNPFTAEIHVMGVLPEHHRRGAGHALVAAATAHCLKNGTEYLTVKTLAPSHPDPGYAKTRRFYEAQGFRPLEVFPLLWDAANPCLFMAKYLR